MNERWYDKTLQQIEEKLNTDVNTGLSPAVLREHQRKNGLNVIFPIKHHSFEECFKKIISETTTLLLLFTAMLTAALEQSVAALVIISLVVFNIIISVFTYSKAQQVFEDMGYLSLPTTKVMRNGKMYLVKSEQLVAGDIIYLSAGDMVPADARLIESDNLQVLEVNLTGVIKPVEKDPLFLRYTHDVPPAQQANMVFASSIIIKGTAKAVVCCTGNDNLVCKLKKNKTLTTQDDIKAISFIKKYSKVWSLLMLALIFVVVILELSFGSYEKKLFDIFLTALSLAAASIGEFHVISSYIIIANGLFGAVKQNKDINSGALIKNISKIENLKNISCLLVHKEGAFSLREVNVRKIYVNDTLYSDGEVHFARNAERVLRYALISTGLYGAKKLIKNNLQNENIYTSEEDAIISISQKCKVYNINLDKNYPILEHVPQSDTSKFETTLVNSNEGYSVACRGSLESILASCTTYSLNGNIYPLDADKKMEIIDEAARLTRKSYKIVAVSSKNTTYNTLRRILSCQSDMTFEGFIAIREKMLTGAAKNIADCQAAGIKVIMLCDDIGDHNRVLASSIGIIKSSSEIVNGRELQNMKDELFRTNVSMYRLYENLNIFQKRKLLELLHAEGEVVGVLSRELDEIILLKESDVGYVQSTTLSGKLDKSGLDMAKTNNSPLFVKNSKDSKKTGSEALKFVSDVIISDADKHGNGGFNAILSSITASKVIYKNLVRFVKYLLTTQLARTFMIICSIFTKSTILTPTQILFSGLVVDFIAMLVIAFEHPDSRLFMNNDNSEEELKSIYKFLPTALLIALIWSVCVILVPILLKFIGFSGALQNTAIIFVSFIFSQIAVLNELLKDTSIFKHGIKFNRAHFIMLFTITAFLTAANYLPKFANLFGFVKSTWIEMIFTFIPAIIIIIVFELKKAFSNIK